MTYEQALQHKLTTPLKKEKSDQWINGMKQVTKEELFALVAEKNVHPQPVGSYDNWLGYTSLWRVLDASHSIIGATRGGTVFSNKEYYVKS